MPKKDSSKKPRKSRKSRERPSVKKSKKSTVKVVKVVQTPKRKREVVESKKFWTTRFDLAAAIILDGLLILFGFVYFALAAYCQTEHGNELQTLSIGISYVFKFLVITGLLLLVTGCIIGSALYSTNLVMLQIGIGCLAFIFILELVIGGMAINYKLSITTHEETMYREMKARFTDIETNQVAWGAMERKNKCCGLDGPRDYKLFGVFEVSTISWFLRKYFEHLDELFNTLMDRLKSIINTGMPETCFPEGSHESYKRGCFGVAKRVVANLVTAVIILAFAVMALVVLLFILLFCFVTGNDDMAEDVDEAMLRRRISNAKNWLKAMHKELNLTEEQVRVMVVINQMKRLDSIGMLKILRDFLGIEDEDLLMEILKQINSADTELEKIEILRSYWVKYSVPNILGMVLKMLEKAEEYGTTEVLRRYMQVEESTYRRIGKEFRSTPHSKWKPLLRRHLGPGLDEKAIIDNLKDAEPIGMREILRKFLKVDDDDELVELVKKLMKNHDPAKWKEILTNYLLSKEYFDSQAKTVIAKFDDADTIGLKEVLKQALGVDDDELLDEIIKKLRSAKSDKERDALLKKYIKDRDKLVKQVEEKRARLEAERKKKDMEERKRREEEERKRREEERIRIEEERRKQEEERRRQEEEKRRQEEEKRRQEEERRRQEEEKRKREEEERMRKEEEKRKQIEEEIKKLAEQERKKREEEERKRREEEDRRRKEEERKRQEEERKRQEEERKRLEEEKRKREEEEKKRKEEEERRRKEEEERIKREEEEERRRRAEEEKLRKEEERKRKAEEEKRKKEEEEELQMKMLQEYLEMQERGTPTGILKELQKAGSEAEQLEILKHWFEIEDEEQLREILKTMLKLDEKTTLDFVRFQLDNADKRRRRIPYNPNFFELEKHDIFTTTPQALAMEEREKERQRKKQEKIQKMLEEEQAKKNIRRKSKMKK